MHTLAKVPAIEDLPSFSCLYLKEHCCFSNEETERERKKEEAREEARVRQILS